MQQLRKRQISDAAAVRILGISRRTFYRYLQSGAIMPPVGKLAKNRRGWTMPEIEVVRTQIEEKKQRP